jgi:hypothetical protein
MAKRELKGEFVIDRKKWLTGEALELPDGSPGPVSHSTLLHSKSGLMCCLGQACRQLGFSKAQLVYREEPADLALMEYSTSNKSALTKTVQAGFCKGTPERVVELTVTAQRLIDANDDSALTREERESAIKRLFRKIGWKITFKGKYPDYTRLKRATV